MATPSRTDSTRKTSLGAIVHVIGLFTGILGTGVVYVTTDDEFTKTNARNAFNWQLLFTVLFLGFLAIVVLNTFATIVIGGIGIVVLFFVVNPAVCILATIKANRGTTWKYPFAPELV